MSIDTRDPRPRTSPRPAPQGPSTLTPWLAWSLVVLVLAASVAGLLVDGVYSGSESIAATLRAFDLVHVVLVVPALVLATALTRRGSALGQLVLASLGAYIVYTYAYYLFGTGFNDLFLLHTAVFGVALWLLVLTLAGLDAQTLANRFGVKTRVRVVAGILTLLAVSLGGLWVYSALDNATTGDVPAGSQLVETDLVVHLGMTLDLALLVPLYAAAATLLWRRMPWGYVLAFVALLPGILHQLTYLVAMPLQVAADVPGAVSTDPGEPVIVLLYLAAATLLLLGTRHPAPEDRGGPMTPSPDAEPPTTVLARWLRPQDYSADARYRAPARLYGKLSRWIGVPLTSLGLAPRHAVTLEVPGRRSGRPRRNPVLVTTLDDVEYLVSLAGESEWVRNVRAADGRAVLHRRGARAVRLLELPPASRAPVLAAYQAAGAARSGEAAARLQARYNFGLSPAPTLADFERIANLYPVFRVEDRNRTV
jgi:hypothetical protein